MRPVENWLRLYGESHQNGTNKLIHWICVPLIVFSLVGALWSLPVPGTVADVSPYLNWATLLLAAGVLYYLFLSPSLALGMLVMSFAMAGAAHWLDSHLATPLWLVSIAIFVAAWIGQFIGHVVEGKRPSFFQDVQFLMIGPLWLLSFLYRRLGIPY